jgi:hypothetical protein
MDGAAHWRGLLYLKTGLLASTTAEYLADTTGVMPAYGYEAHVTCLLRAAKLLVEQRRPCGDAANGHRGSGSSGH